jgi:hypothetical protein
VDDDIAPERARLRWGQEPFQVALPELPRESTGDEDRLALVRDAARSKLVENRRERLAPRIRLCAGQRKGRWLDDDGHATARERQLLERRPVEREAKRVSHGGAHVDDAGRRSRRLQEDVTVAEGDVDDARAGQQRDAAHVAIPAATAYGPPHSSLRKGVPGWRRPTRVDCGR